MCRRLCRPGRKAQESGTPPWTPKRRQSRQQAAPSSGDCQFAGNESWMDLNLQLSERRQAEPPLRSMAAQGRASGWMHNSRLTRFSAIIDDREPGEGEDARPQESLFHLQEAMRRRKYPSAPDWTPRSEEHTSELQSRQYLVCR